MKIAFLHYHLKTGGVSTVLKQQISALKDRCEVLVLTGDNADTVLPCRVVEIPGLGYDHPDIPASAPKTTAERILKTLSDMWPGGCDVLHIHNPTLAKNQNLIHCIKWLQTLGVTLFLQIHDFAEDGRPGAYSQESYPEDCHYGVINTRDKQILVDAGLKPSGVHLIPNAIYPLPLKTGHLSEGLVLYPVRAIRRKNIGEAILLSLYLLPGQYLGITLPPNSIRDMASYQDWQAYVKRNHLNVHFEIGLRHDYAKLVGTASSMLTTSITEGFGFSFLEPWTAGKMLWGRRLEDICTDFEENGLCLDFLYDRLDIPLAWFDAKLFYKAWQKAVTYAAGTYRHPVDPERIHQHSTHLARRGVIDFGLLNERYQRQILSHVLSNPEAKRQLKSLNPRLSFSLSGGDMSEILENNHRIVTAHYGVETYREKLLSIYERVVHKPVHQRVDKQVLLDAFFDLEGFSLLQWGAYEK
jgi:hypothetical protein